MFNEPKARIPRLVVRWQLALTLGPMVAFSVFYAAIVVLVWFGWLDLKWLSFSKVFGFARIPLSAALPAFMLVGFLLARWYIRSVRRRVAAAEGRLCTHCCYDLSALAEQGVCPECGIAYSMAALRQAWTESKLLADPPVL